MMTLKTIIKALEAFAPLSWQEEYDNSGLQLGLFDAQAEPSGEKFSPETEIRGIMLCVDITEEVVDEAIQKGCNLIVAHHPLIFAPIRRITGQTYQERCLVKALKNGIALYAIHTNLDNAPGGISWEMARLLGLQNVQTLIPFAGDNVAAGVDADVDACSAGADVDACSAGACTSSDFGATASVGCGVIGDLPSAVSRADFQCRLIEIFQPVAMKISKSGRTQVKRIALCGGSGGSFIQDAIAAGADCYVTGEIRYHDFFEGGDCLLVALGHYESEKCAMDLLERYLRQSLSRETPPLFKTAVDTNPIG